MEYILFGAGEYGKRALKLLGREHVKIIFDNNPTKWNTFLEGVPIREFNLSVNAASSDFFDDKCVVVSVSAEKANEVIHQLKSNGVNNYICYEEFAARIIKERILARRDYIGVYKKAIGWIRKHSIEGEGIINNTDLYRSYPEVTGYLIPSLLKWGHRELACTYADWLCSIQKVEGAWFDTEDREPYIFDTAQVLKGLLAIRRIMPQVDTHILAGCEWMLSLMHEDGRFVTPTTNAWGDDSNVCDEIVHIYCLSVLMEAAELFNRPEYREKALRIWHYYKQNYYEKIMNFSLLSHFYAYLMESLLDIGEVAMAKEAMRKMEEYQKDNGAIPAYHDCDWICSTGLFQLSLVWFRLGDIERGNKAFDYACKLQNESGGWFGSYVWEENMMECNTYFPSSEISWAVKYFLDALYYKNVAEFEAAYDDFLPHIDKADGRYQVIQREVCALPQTVGNRILDIGCGKGRYLKNLAEDMPNNQYFGVDISTEVMKSFDAGIADKKQGSLTDIPYDDNVFDLTYACESLEHAIDIENALGEMARVTKPGGKIIIVDKNFNALGKLEIGPWEQWFEEDTLKKLMQQYCADVTMQREITYENKQADGLFCAWIGQVKK